MTAGAGDGLLERDGAAPDRLSQNFEADVNEPPVSRPFSFTTLSPNVMNVPGAPIALLKPTPLRVTVLPVARMRAPPSI